MTAESYSNPLRDGNLALTVGGVDVSAAAKALRYSSTSPGGFGEASFRLPCADRPHDNSDSDRTKWADLSGLGHDGTLTGFAWTAASGWDGSGLPSDPDFLVFSGDDDQVTVAASPDFQLSEYSLDVWMRSDIEDYDLCIFANGTYSKFLRWHNTYCILQQRIGGTARQMYFGDDPEIGVGNLCHVIATVKDGEQRFYVGGVEDEAARQSYAGAVDTGAGQAITLGLLSGDAWQGALASARLYGHVLTPTEAAQNHAAGPNGRGYVTSGLKLDLNASRAVPQDPAAPYDSAVLRGAAVSIAHSAQTLFAGTVTNDVDVATVSQGVATYDVAAAGLWYGASQRKDALLALCDTDLDQWELGTRGQPRAYETDNDGRLLIAARNGTAYAANKGAGLHYWLHRGLGDPDEHIDHIIFVLGDYGDGTGRGLDLAASSVWRFSVQRGDSPYDPALAAQVIYKPPAQVAAGTIYRVPAAAGSSLTEPARCVRLRLYPTGDKTPDADKYVVIREMYVMMSADYVAVDEIAGSYPATVTTTTDHGLKVGDRVYVYGNSAAAYRGIWTVLTVPTTTTFTIDAANATAGTGGSLERLPSPVDGMALIGTGIGGAGSVIADSSYADALPGSVMIRPHESWADAQEELAQQFSAPQEWGWWDGGEWWQESIVPPATADYTVDAKVPGITYDVHASDEGQPEAVRVLHKLAHDVGRGKMRLKVTYTPSGGGAQVTVNCPLTFDGRLRSAHNVYATACAGGAAVDQVDTDDDVLWVGQNKAKTAPYYRLHESFVSFDLSAIPADATVNAATLSAMAKSKQTSGYDFVAYVYAYDFGATLTADDWRTPTQLQAMAISAERRSSETRPGELFEFTNRPTFIATVQAALTDGYLRIVMASDLLELAIAPDGPEYLGLWSSEGDTGPDPLLGQVVQTLVTASGVDEPGFGIGTQQVDVLDLSDRMLTEADAGAMGAQYLAWRGRTAYHGSITIATPTVPLTAGGTKATPYIRAGEWIAEASIGVPHYITAADYDVDSSVMTLSVGEEPGEFRPIIPRGRR